MTGAVRSGSAAAGLLELLLRQPVLSAEDAAHALSVPLSSVYTAIARLESADVLWSPTDRKRDQVWGAGLVLDELEDLGSRIARAAR